MRYRRRPALAIRAALLLAAAFALAGCAHATEARQISPTPDVQSRTDVGLGPGVRPLSSGPGEKSSPSWEPSGDRIAFVVDGYVVEKPLDAPDVRRRTTRDFGAQAVSWISGSSDGLLILGADQPSRVSDPPADTLTAYQALSKEGSLEVKRLLDGVSSMAPDPDSGGVLLALEDGARSRLALVGASGEPLTYPGTVEGRVTGLSLSPDRDQAVVAVQSPGPRARFEIHAFSSAENRQQLLARLGPDLEVIGAPQWTRNGIYYVAREPDDGSPGAVPYSLYRLSPGSGGPELAPGVGSDFVALGVSRSPDGEHLAIIGRRNPGSAPNLYKLDTATGSLSTLTSNENMEIKAGAGDLFWSVDGQFITIVARSLLSGPETYPAPVDAVVSGFYNLYEVPVEEAVRDRSR